jgi:hypothetical protein
LSDLSSGEQTQLAGLLSKLLGSLEGKLKQKQDTAEKTQAGNSGRITNSAQG